MVVRKGGRRRGQVRLLLLLALLLRQVGVCVVVAQAGSVLVAFSTYCKYNIVLLLETLRQAFQMKLNPTFKVCDFKKMNKSFQFMKT